VADLFSDGIGIWPSNWNSVLASAQSPVIGPDKLVWKDCNGVIQDFTVSMVWDCIRPRAPEVSWYSLVWFSNCIPKHAFHLWLVMKRKLKTQDLLQAWDVHSTSSISSMCPLCELQSDSHEHLFFECSFSSQVWTRVCGMASIVSSSPNWNTVILAMIPDAKRKNVEVISSKLVLAAVSYFIWQERNNRLFNNTKRSIQQLCEVIWATVRLKLLSMRFKRNKRVEKLVNTWKLPSSLIVTM
jgi:hypothetical protein